MIHHADDWLTIHGGDVRDILPTLPSESVDCIVTSPPYWGLRDYGTATWIGGDEACEHRTDATGSTQNKGNNNREAAPFRGVCGRCGAFRSDSQLGLEPTPEQYVANLVGVFRELRRVLKPSGTCWLNLGDSYNAYNGGAGPSSSISAGASTTERPQLETGYGLRTKGLKPKDLVGIPWRVAFALQADGWCLRSDIIWAKPNPMPESVTDRPTKAHEYLFLLTKSARYYYDAEAVAEATLPASIARYAYGDPATTRINKGGDYREAWNNGDKHIGVPTVPDNPATRNLRSVWTIATRPDPGAHFAVFPPELPERCIKAGSSERGVCPECGAPWERQIERVTGRDWNAHKTREERLTIGNGTGATADKERILTPHTTTGWLPSCEPLHNNVEHWTSSGIISSLYPQPIPAVVLDPFAGSGTVGLVANRLSRRAILIDLNPAYLEQQMERNAQMPVGL